jgi:hypothetical protein
MKSTVYFRVGAAHRAHPVDKSLVIESFFYLFTIEEARLLNIRSLPRRLSLPENYDEQFIDRILNVYETSHDDFWVCFAGWFNGVDNSNWNFIYEENILEYISMAT